MAHEKGKEASPQIVVTTNTYALFGKHIYVTIKNDDKLIAEYRALNIYDASSFVNRALMMYDKSNIQYQGDVVMNFVYHREGD